MKNHGIKPKVEKRGQQFLGRYKSRRPSSLPTDFRSFVGADRKSVSVPPALKNDLVVDSPSGQGLTHTHTHTWPISAHMWGNSAWRQFFVESAGVRWSHVLFGRRAGLVPQLLPLLWLVESCMCRLRVDVKRGRREPSAGYRRWWDP